MSAEALSLFVQLLTIIVAVVLLSRLLKTKIMRVSLLTISGLISLGIIRFSDVSFLCNVCTATQLIFDIFFSLIVFGFVLSVLLALNWLKRHGISRS